MNNPIFIFSLDLIIKSANYAFHKLTSELFFFPLFFWESSAGDFWSSNPNKLLHVRHFAASNQYNRPDLFKKHDGHTEVSVCAVIGGFRSSAFVSFFTFGVCLFYLLFWLKAMKNVIVNGWKREVNNYDWTQQTRIKNR